MLSLPNALACSSANWDIPLQHDDTNARIVFPLFADSINNKRFARDGVNPGCGGTQFVTIMLAMRLADERPDYDVVLLHSEKIMLEQPAANLRQLRTTSEDLANVDLLNDPQTVFVVPAGLMQSWLKASRPLPECRLVVWLHHPYVQDWQLVRANCQAYVSVGTHQYYTNDYAYNPHWHIANLFVLPPEPPAPADGRTREDEDGIIRLVYLGALSPAKGFHHVARQWPSLRDRFPTVCLHVIGSTQTYSGQAPEHDLIPTRADYAARILTHIPRKDIESARVIFHGNLGREKFDIIRGCQAALLNPTGSTEAFPASPLECLSLGVPVIASDDYGMMDVIQFFPELALSAPDEIPAKVQRLVDEPRSRREMQARARNVAQFFAGQNAQMLLRWQQLIDAIVSGEKIVSNPPMQSFQGDRARLRKRRRRSILGMHKRRFMAILSRASPRRQLKGET